MKTGLGRNKLALDRLGRAGDAAAKKRKLPGASAEESTEIMESMGLTWPLSTDMDGAVQVRELERHEQGGDWMTRLVSSDLFSSLPPDNIQQLFAELEAIEAEPGDIIVEQGTLNEFLYIVAEGECVMTRMVPELGPELMLGVLEEGDTFGEEALLCGAQHNVSVKVLSGGFLMRLPRHSFEKLVSGPAIKSVAHAETRELVRQGAVWLDVRTSKPPAAKTIAGSLNIPLDVLRFEAAKLDRTKTYIVYAETVERRSCGAFLLARQGVDVYYLREEPQLTQDDKVSNSTATAAVAEPVAKSLPKIETMPDGQQVADEVSALRAQVETMRNELERATNARRQMADSARELLQRYEKARQAAQAERSKYDALEIKQALIEADAIRSADSNDAKYEQERKTNSSKFREGELERQRLTTHLDAFKQRLKTLTHALKEMQLERDGARSELAREREDLESRLKTSEGRLLSVSSALRNEREAHQVASDRFADDRARFETMSNESSDRLEEARSTVHGLRQERQATVSRFEQEVARLQTRLAEREGRLEETASILQSVQQERRAMVNQLEQERAQLESRLAETEGRLRENAKALQTLEQQHQQSRAKVSGLERERASLEANLRVAEASLQDVEQRVDKAASVRLVTERASGEVLQAQQVRTKTKAETLRSQAVEPEALTEQLMQAQAKLEQATQAERSSKPQRYAVLEGALAALHKQIGELASLREQVLPQSDSTLGLEAGGREHGPQQQQEFEAEKRSRDEYVDSDRPKAKLIAFSPLARAPR